MVHLKCIINLQKECLKCTVHKQILDQTVVQPIHGTRDLLIISLSRPGALPTGRQYTRNETDLFRLTNVNCNTQAQPNKRSLTSRSDATQVGQRGCVWHCVLARCLRVIQ